jgi:hypothetical protein
MHNIYSKKDANDLSGTIPTELGLLKSLEELRLEDNSLLTGTIPSEVCDLLAGSLSTFMYGKLLDHVCPVVSLIDHFRRV